MTPITVKSVRRKSWRGTVKMVDISQFSKLKIPLAWSVIFAEGIGYRIRYRTYLYFPLVLCFFQDTRGWNSPISPDPQMGWEFPFSRDKEVGTTPFRINTLILLVHSNVFQSLKLFVAFNSSLLTVRKLRLGKQKGDSEMFYAVLRFRISWLETTTSSPANQARPVTSAGQLGDTDLRLPVDRKLAVVL